MGVTINLDFYLTLLYTYTTVMRYNAHLSSRGCFDLTSFLSAPEAVMPHPYRLGNLNLSAFSSDLSSQPAANRYSSFSFVLSLLSGNVTVRQQKRNFK